MQALQWPRLGKKSSMIKTRLNLVTGGRNSPIGRGYRACFYLMEEIIGSAQIVFIDGDTIFPGQNAAVNLTFTAKNFISKLSAGTEFTLREGNIVVATGLIIEVINDL